MHSSDSSGHSLTSATAFVQFQVISRGSRDKRMKKKIHARREVTDAAAAKKTMWTRPILKGWKPNVHATRNVLFVDLLKLR